MIQAAYHPMPGGRVWAPDSQRTNPLGIYLVPSKLASESIVELLFPPNYTKLNTNSKEKSQC
jgi:hypothetical protein